MKDENKILGEEKISKLLFKFSLPCILSLLISSLYNIVDQIFIGNSNIGYLGNAATSIVFPITIVTMAIAWAIGDGSAAYLSLCLGRKDTKNAHIAIGNGILINFIASIILTILGFLYMDKLLYLFGASDTTLPIAKDYLTILLYFIPGYMLSNGMNSIIRADGSPKISMISNLAGAITNIILDPIFIFVLRMGIKGAALATVIGEFISLVITIIYFIKPKNFKLKKESFKINFKILNNVIKLGISTFLTQLSIVLISLVCNLMLAKYGALSKYGADIPIATLGICMKVFTIIINLVIGLIVGAQPILGYNYGAKKYKRIKEIYKLVMILTIVTGAVGMVLFEFCPKLLINMFGTENELYMEFAIKTFQIFLFFIVFTCVIKVSSIFFQSVGKPFLATIVSLIRDLLCFIPLVIILPIKFGIEGILYAAPLSDLIGIIVTVILLIKFFNNLDKESNIAEDSTVKLVESKKGVIITISRTHGSKGKFIGKQLAERLNIPCYYKELTALAAEESGLDKNFISKLNQSENIMHELYLTTSPVKYAIEAQEAIIKKIASKGSCVIIGRAADYVLRDNEDVIKIFIHANEEYRIESLKEMYGDTLKEAKKNLKQSDKNRASYYKLISGKEFGNANNYDLCIDSSIGAEKTVDIICEYVNKYKN